MMAMKVVREVDHCMMYISCLFESTRVGEEGYIVPSTYEVILEVGIANIIPRYSMLGEKRSNDP